MSKAQSVDLGLAKDSRENKPWDFPDCPECGRHIYVDRFGQGKFDFRCYKCGPFHTPPRQKLREELKQ